MLGNEILSARLGGIYALQQLAADYPGQLRLIRLFCGFVRHPTRDNVIDVPTGTNGEQDKGPQTLRADVQDIIQAIDTRSQAGIVLERSEQFKLYLRDAELSNA